MKAPKTFRRKVETAGEAVVFGLFIVAAGLASLQLLNTNAVVLNEWAKTATGYLLGAYAALVFGYLTYKAVDNK